jgi:hypothetical protein
MTRRGRARSQVLPLVREAGAKLETIQWWNKNQAWLPEDADWFENIKTFTSNV